MMPDRRTYAKNTSELNGSNSSYLFVWNPVADSTVASLIDKWFKKPALCLEASPCFISSLWLIIKTLKLATLYKRKAHMIIIHMHAIFSI